MINTSFNIPSLLDSLAESDFNENTIKLDENKNIILKSKIGINPKKFNSAVSRLIELIDFQPQILLENTVVKNLSTISTKLFSQASEITDGFEAHKANIKISMLVQKAALYQWNTSKKGMSEIIKKLPISEIADKLSKSFEYDGVFLFPVEGGSLLGIDKYIESQGTTKKDPQLFKKIREVLKTHPLISKINVQGSRTISRESMEKILEYKGELPFKRLTGTRCIWRVPEFREIVLNPSLVINSQFFLAEPSFSEGTSTGKKDKNTINNEDLKPEVIDFLNKNAENLDSVDIENLGKEFTRNLLNTANLFTITPLLTRFDDFLSSPLSKKLNKKWGNREKLFDRTCRLYNLTKHKNLPKLKQICEDIFNDYILYYSDRSFYGSTKTRLDKVLEVLKKLKELCETNDMELAPVKLDPCCERLGDDDLKTIGDAYPNIISLKFNAISDGTCSVVKHFPSLQELTFLKKAKITQEIVPYLRSLKNLQKLTFSECSTLDPKMCGFLAEYPNLQALRFISCSNITDEIGLIIKDCKVLKKLEFKNCPITDKLGPDLESLPLTELILTNCDNIKDKIGESIEKLSQLQSLEVNSCGLSSNFINYLLKLPLRNLLLGEFSELTDNDIELLSQNLKQLESLTLKNNYKLTDEFFLYLKNFPRLKQLHVGHRNLTDAIGPTIEQLQDLEILEINNFGDNFRESIINHFMRMPKLRKLSLTRCIKNSLYDNNVILDSYIEQLKNKGVEVIIPLT